MRQNYGQMSLVLNPFRLSYNPCLIPKTYLLETKKPPNISKGRIRIGPVAIARDSEFVAVDTR